MSFQDSLAFLISNLAHAVGPILGFVSAWLLFELQEYRKQRAAVRLSRQSLVVELEWLESLLSMTVVKCAAQSDIIPQGVQEFRWFLKDGVRRNMLEELPAEMVESKEKVLAYPDEEIVKLLAFFRHEKVAAEIPIPIINAVLAAPTSASLSPEEIKRLIDVRWQSSMLATETRNLNEHFRLTFTVSDCENHQRVIQNHASSLRAYGRRASHLLTRVRLALTSLAAKDSKLGMTRLN